MQLQLMDPNCILLVFVCSHAVGVKVAGFAAQSPMSKIIPSTISWNDSIIYCQFSLLCNKTLILSSRKINKDTTYVGKELSYSYELGTKAPRMVVPQSLHLLSRLYFSIVDLRNKLPSIDSTLQMNSIRNQLDWKFIIRMSITNY